MPDLATLTRRKSKLFRTLGKTADATTSADPENDIQVWVNSKKAVLRFTPETFSVTKVGTEPSLSETTLSTSVRHVLQAQISGEVLIISTLAKKDRHLRLVKIEAKPNDTSREYLRVVEGWVQRLMKAAYPDTQPRRNFKVLVNPAGGSGKAKTIFEKGVRPLFEAAGCSFDVTYTTHVGHAREIAMTLHLQYDAVVCVSGDGITHEVVNGFARRLDAKVAFQKVAIVPIPAGSGNGFCVNLLGVDDCFDVSLASLNALKGKPMHIDLASVTLMESRETIYSVLSQAGGLMAELDLGTENLRWMGDKRFILGFLRGLIGNVGRPLKVTIKGGESDKPKMLAAFLNNTPQITEAKSPADASPSSPHQLSQAMPGPCFIDEDDSGEGWREFDKPILYIYGGMMPYVGRDLMDFPMKQPGDGSIDLVVQEIETRATMVNMIENAAKGDPFFLHTHHYYKAQAYRVAPIKSSSKSKGYFAIDGEAFPYQPFHVEAHHGVMTTFSMHGKYLIGEFGKQGKTFSVG